MSFFSCGHGFLYVTWGAKDSFHVWITFLEGFQRVGKDEVERNLKKILVLTKNAVVLTERETALLAVAITEMCQAGLYPYQERYVVQIVFWLH